MFIGSENEDTYLYYAPFLVIMPEETAIKVCPMCNEINKIKMGQTELRCIRCGYKILEEK